MSEKLTIYFTELIEKKGNELIQLNELLNSYKSALGFADTAINKKIDHIKNLLELLNNYYDDYKELMQFPDSQISIFNSNLRINFPLDRIWQRTENEKIRQAIMDRKIGEDPYWEFIFSDSISKYYNEDDVIDEEDKKESYFHLINSHCPYCAEEEFIEYCKDDSLFCTECCTKFYSEDSDDWEFDDKYDKIICPNCDIFFPHFLYENNVECPYCHLIMTYDSLDNEIKLTFTNIVVYKFQCEFSLISYLENYLSNIYN